MLLWLSIAAAGVLVFLSWNLYRRFAVDRVAKFIEGRRATSRMVSGAEFVEGNRHLQVALALTSSELFYENDDMQASLDLRLIREIEYDASLATGQPIAHGTVLRLRSYSQVFEFVLPDDIAARWRTMLPVRQHERAAASERSMRVASAT